MNAEHEPGSSAQLVEISGWDIADRFFVEKQTLHTTEEGVRRVGLRTKLQVGAKVFARLIDPGAGGGRPPIPYSVISVGGPDHEGFFAVSLVSLWRRRKSRVNR